MSPDATWDGDVYLSPTRALYVGRVRDTQPHAHHAIQACFALDDPFRLREGPDDAWMTYDAAIVAANTTHQLDGGGARHAILYIEPESLDGRRFTETASRSGITPLSSAALDRVRSALRPRDKAVLGETGAGDAREALADVSRTLDLAPLVRHSLDRRIGRVLGELRADPNRYGSIAQLATGAGLSPRRFRHVFKAEMGVSCQRYIVWIRLYDSVRELAAGASLTEAAHRAGFTDSAYLSRTFRRMFGITPSSIRGSVHLIDDAQT